MSIYAIGVIRGQNGEIRVRLISPDKLKCKDVPITDIPFYIKKEQGIKNLELGKNNEIKWVQGSAERYPIIDLMNGENKNEYAVVVLGIADTGLQKYYRICNVSGQVTTVKANELIEYGRKYTISNCKIVKKANSDFISSIEGELESIDTKPTFKVNGALNHLSINIPFLMSDELIIPDTIEGRPLMDVQSISVTPSSSALMVKKLTIPKCIKQISLGLFTSFNNLEELNILGREVNIYEGAFSILPKIKKIHINSIRASGMNICSGLKQLEEFVCDTPMAIIHSGTFSGCSLLNINSVVVEGTRTIETKAFYSNRVTEHLELPSTITSVTDNSFEKCLNLRTVDVKTEILSIYTNTRGNSKGLFAGIEPITVYLNKNCVMHNEKIASTAQIVFKDPTERDKSVDKKIKKSNILGLSLEATKLITNPSEILDALLVAPQEDITNMVTNLLNRMLKMDRTWRIQDDIDIGGFKIRISINGCVGLTKAKKMKNIGKYIVIMGKNIIFYPIDRELIRNTIKNEAKYNAEITPAFAKSKYIKSIDVSDDGTIRLIYEIDNQTSVKYITKFVHKS